MRMREITRFVKVALKCLIAVVLVDVDLPYWTSKVEHLIAFAANVSNICTAHAQKRLFMHFRCKFITALPGALLPRNELNGSLYRTTLLLHSLSDI